MESQTEKIIKLALVLILVMAGLLFWLLPKTKLAKHLIMSEKLFIFTNIIGVTCGIVGLVVTFVLPQFIVELHLWALIVMPFALAEIYWLMIIRIRKTSEIVDEKQYYNITKAGALTMAFSILVLCQVNKVGYNLFNLILASSFENRQSTLACLKLR
jgi:hypothetical protein